MILRWPQAVALDPVRWRVYVDDLMSRFAQVEPRRRARESVLVVVRPAGQNCCTISEHVGLDGPDGLQHLLRKAVWDHDGVRDDLRGYVVEHLGADECSPARSADRRFAGAGGWW
jgi:hypothetical protein